MPSRTAPTAAPLSTSLTTRPRGQSRYAHGWVQSLVNACRRFSMVARCPVACPSCLPVSLTLPLHSTPHSLSRSGTAGLAGVFHRPAAANPSRLPLTLPPYYSTPPLPVQARLELMQASGFGASIWELGQVGSSSSNRVGGAHGFILE